MRYYIINEKTGRWSLMTFKHKMMVDVFKQMYPTLKFILKDETLHGDKMHLDPAQYQKYLAGVV